MNSHQSRAGDLRVLIGSACEMIGSFGHHSPLFPKEAQDHTNDAYVLLEDAIELYCRAISAQRDEPVQRRWSPRLVDHLFSNPTDYERTLDEIARDDCPDALRPVASQMA